MGATGGSGEVEFSDPGRVGDFVEVLERDPEGPDEGLWGVGGARVEDLEGEEGVVEGRVGREREGEALVPDGFDGSGFVGFGG